MFKKKRQTFREGNTDLKTHSVRNWLIEKIDRIIYKIQNTIKKTYSKKTFELMFLVSRGDQQFFQSRIYLLLHIDCKQRIKRR